MGVWHLVNLLCGHWAVQVLLGSNSLQSCNIARGGTGYTNLIR